MLLNICNFNFINNKDITKKYQKNHFKIISGYYRGRRVNFLDSKELRPTTSRTRETLFNWLRQDIINKKILDPFAGSGSLIFEAISRGAREVYAIEKNKKTFNKLSENSKIFDKCQITLINADCVKHLQKKSNKYFDLIFLDPPFAKEMLNQTISIILENGYIEKSAKCYIESEFAIKVDKLPLTESYNYNIEKQKKSGSVYYCLINIERI